MGDAPLQNMEHKFVELLSANFAPVPEEHVRRQLDFRYKALKSRLAVVQACLADVYAVVSWPWKQYQLLILIPFVQ